MIFIVVFLFNASKKDLKGFLPLFHQEEVDIDRKDIVHSIFLFQKHENHTTS
eukprot:m.122081 g.122081  ORF g.122081 m.122081 type:complete len:52 (+) comp9388_c0_seq1:4518-4673(+)